MSVGLTRPAIRRVRLELIEARQSCRRRWWRNWHLVDSIGEGSILISNSSYRIAAQWSRMESRFVFLIHLCTTRAHLAYSARESVIPRGTGIGQGFLPRYAVSTGSRVRPYFHIISEHNFLETQPIKNADVYILSLLSTTGPTNTRKLFYNASGKPRAHTVVSSSWIRLSLTFARRQKPSTRSRFPGL